jgi:HK97 family phage portal protein
MGLMDFLRSGRVSAPEPVARPEPPVSASSPVSSETQWNGFVTAGGTSRAGVRVDERTVLSLPATMQAIRVLSGVFAATPRHYYRRSATGRERLTDAPLSRLIHDAPNGYQTAFEFFELYMQDILLAGNFYAYVSRDFAGRPVALTRLKPPHVKVAEFFDRADGYTLFYDATLPDGTAGRFPAREILHVRGMSRDGLYGLNPLAYMRDAFGGAVATADFAARYWQSGARPDTVLTTKQKVSPEAREAIRADWKRLYSGPNGEKVAVLDQELEPKFLSHDNQEAQFIETRTFQVVDIARAWGVPPHLVFELSRATFSNIEQQSLEFITYHLGPHYSRLEQAITRAFAEPGHYFEHLTDALVRGDLKSRMEAYWLQRQMGMVSADELRSRENLNSIGGAAGEERWRPGNMTVAGTPVQPAASIRAPATEGDS